MLWLSLPLHERFGTIAPRAKRGAALVAGRNQGRDLPVPFDFQPLLRSPLIQLRPLRSEDFDALYAVASDPLIWEQHPDNNRYELSVFRKFFQDAMASGSALVAIDPDTQKVIGTSRYHGYDEAKREVEIGWTFLARSYWGGTYNGAMKELMLRHAFQFVDSVVFLVGRHNLRSQRAMEKIGGVRIGVRQNNQGRERIVYEITAAAFSQRYQGPGRHL